MAVMPIDVKTTTAKFIQLVAIQGVLSAAAINTITLEARLPSISSYIVWQIFVRQYFHELLCIMKILASKILVLYS